MSTRYSSRPADQLNLFSQSTVEDKPHPVSARKQSAQKATASDRPAGASLASIHAQSQLKDTPRSTKSKSQVNLFSTDNEQTMEKKPSVVKAIGGISSLKLSDEILSEISDTRSLSSRFGSSGVSRMGAQSQAVEQFRGIATFTDKHTNRETMKQLTPQKQYSQHAALKNKSQLAISETGLNSADNSENVFHRANVKSDKNKSAVFEQQAQPIKRTKAFVPEPKHEERPKTASIAVRADKNQSQFGFGQDTTVEKENTVFHRAGVQDKNKSSIFRDGQQQQAQQTQSRKALVQPLQPKEEQARPSVKIFTGRKDSGRLW